MKGPGELADSSTKNATFAEIAAHGAAVAPPGRERCSRRNRQGRWARIHWGRFLGWATAKGKTMSTTLDAFLVRTPGICGEF
jgi:hypothetical protein